MGMGHNPLRPIPVLKNYLKQNHVWVNYYMLLVPCSYSTYSLVVLLSSIATFLMFMTTSIAHVLEESLTNEDMQLHLKNWKKISTT